MSDERVCTFWITGITASGKTTLGKKLHDGLIEHGISNVKFIDSEEIRKLLKRTYGFSVEDRFAVLDELVEIVKDCHKSGNIAIVSTVCHKHKMREKARQNLRPFMEIFLDCPSTVCAERDFKGHYARAFAGEYEVFIGVTEQYEKTVNPELVINTANLDIEESSRMLINEALKFLQHHQIINNFVNN